MRALERVDYRDGERPLTGWLAHPATKARAAVVIFPTIANVNPHMRRRAQMLADAGYAAMIADFYGEEVRDFDHASEVATELRIGSDRYRARLSAAIEALRDHAAGLKLAAIGYCMGGQAALEVARAGEDVAAVVSFHGLLDTMRPADPGAIRGRILVCHGDADPMVPRQRVLAFWDEMDRAGADWHFYAYSGVKHGFTDPQSDSRGVPAIAYDASADRQSWAAMLGLFDEVFC